MANKWEALQAFGATLSDVSNAIRNQPTSYLDRYMQRVREREDEELQQSAMKAVMDKYEKEGVEGLGEILQENANNEYMVDAVNEFGTLQKTIKQLRGETLDYKRDARLAAGGEMSYEDLKRDYPTKLEQSVAQQQYFGKRLQPGMMEPMERSPEFEEGGGFGAWRSKNKAKIDPKTQTVIDQIERGTRADYEELLERRDEAVEAGVDVDAIREYFGER